MKLGRHLYDVTHSEGASNMSTFFFITLFRITSDDLYRVMYQRMVREHGNILPQNYRELWIWGNWD